MGVHVNVRSTVAVEGTAQRVSAAFQIRYGTTGMDTGMSPPPGGDTMVSGDVLARNPVWKQSGGGGVPSHAQTMTDADKMKKKTEPPIKNFLVFMGTSKMRTRCRRPHIGERSPPY
jgi:hypothetical protein